MIAPISPKPSPEVVDRVLRWWPEIWPTLTTTQQVEFVRNWSTTQPAMKFLLAWSALPAEITVQIEALVAPFAELFAFLPKQPAATPPNLGESLS